MSFGHTFPKEDTCQSYEEEDTCQSYEEEDTCQSYEEEDTCHLDTPCRRIPRRALPAHTQKSSKVSIQWHSVAFYSKYTVFFSSFFSIDIREFVACTLLATWAGQNGLYPAA
jgi:hypothetical protein